MSARLNRVDPFGDIHSTPERGLFTGNRGCLVDANGKITRHHRGQLWITCVISYKDWKSPLDQPGHWTPLFFLDDAVALAAGHRPCGLCRRDDYLSYSRSVQRGLGVEHLPTATELNRRLAAERLNRGRGLQRAGDRKMWIENATRLPDGVVIIGDGGEPDLLIGNSVHRFDFGGWKAPREFRRRGEVRVLTPPTSVLALVNGYVPRLHHSVAA